MDALDGSPDYCTPAMGATSLGDISTYAIDNGTQFIETTKDISADPNCYTYMQSALATLLTPPYTNCLY
jgi:hypothetical protein